MKNSKYDWLNELGGFIFWFLIKFGKTNLKQEQSIEKAPRNIIIFCFFIVAVCLLNLKFWKL